MLIVAVKPLSGGLDWEWPTTYGPFESEDDANRFAFRLCSDWIKAGDSELVVKVLNVYSPDPDTSAIPTPGGWDEFRTEVIRRSILRAGTGPDT